MGRTQLYSNRVTTRLSRPLQIALCFVIAQILTAVVPAAADEPALRPPWTTSTIKGSPEPPLPFIAERAFPNLTFTNCLDMGPIPGTDRLFVVEQSGKIYSFQNHPDVVDKQLFADFASNIEGVGQTYSLAFHPDFLSNRYCYVCYIIGGNLDDGTHVARFKISDTDPPQIDFSTEETIITWLSGGHNGCTLKFGHDGCLYISTGDGAGPNPPDTKRTGQDISDLLSSILRIDVDHPSGDRNYTIPDDNPFIDVPEARGEVWAFGLRNPWRMSVDRKTGDLWVGDVGWELWEMLDRVERGGNYGWAVKEGPASTHPEWPQGPGPILEPTIAHPHSESSSITDGLTYYGERLTALHGHHIYSDYDTGRFWAFRWENGEVTEHREIADTTHRVAGFGEDHAGEMYFLDHPAGTIHRLIPNPADDASSKFPHRLSQTGLFQDTESLTPTAGVVPYSIRAEQWADHAVSTRHVAVPDNGVVTPAAAAWTAPENTVLVRTLELDMQHNQPSSRRRVETQILHYDGVDWKPYTYRWNEAQTDADLVDDKGDTVTFRVEDASAPNGIREQSWHFAGRAECQRCHNRWSGPLLGFQTAQLNVPSDSGKSQLDEFTDIGLIETSIASDQRPRLSDPHDDTADLDDRARAWLHVNCAHCHRMHAGGSVLSEMQYDLPLEKTKMLDARPSQGTFSLPRGRVITPGDPFRSVLYYRIAKLGGGRMPRVGSSEVDRDGLALIRDWISEMPPTPDVEAPAESQQREALMAKLTEAPHAGSAVGTSVQLLESTDGALRLLTAIEQDQLGSDLSKEVIRKAVASPHSAVRDLFERFLPASQRIRRLGTTVDPVDILALRGQPENGRQLFLAAEGVNCRNCHRVGKEGQAVGPDLDDVGVRNNREQLLDSILNPSRQVRREYQAWLVETKQGRVLSGLMVERTDEEVVLRDSGNKLRHIPAGDVEEVVPQQQSLMPELLFRDMTAQQLADLVAWLETLKTPR